MPLLSGEPAERDPRTRRDLGQAVEITNLYAPEHAHVISEDHEAILQDLDAVGMVAVGDFSPVALADYGAGPSHALPSGGAATWASALGTHDFSPAPTTPLHPDALRTSAPTSNAWPASKASRTTPPASRTRTGVKGIREQKLPVARLECLEL